MALIPVAVGEARESYGTKYQYSIRETSGNGNGWTHQFAFQAYDNAAPGTVPVSSKLPYSD